MTLSAANAAKAPADNMDFIDIKLSIPWFGETGMVRT